MQGRSTAGVREWEPVSYALALVPALVHTNLFRAVKLGVAVEISSTSRQGNAASSKLTNDSDRISHSLSVSEAGMKNLTAEM